MKRHVTLTVNGAEYDLHIEPNRLLLQALREDIGLTGTKEGCSIGVCGACSVTVDGRLVSACLTLAVACQGKAILTIEGLAQDGELHPLQRAFIQYGGFQCGICTPGHIIAAKELGATAYIAKPFSAVELREKMEKIATKLLKEKESK